MTGSNVLRSNSPYFSSFPRIHHLSKTPFTCLFETRQNKRSSLSNKALQFILCPLVRVETMVGRWNFRKTKIGQFYRGSKAPCFHPLIIPISFHHGGSAVLAGHPCFNKARRSTIEEVEYVWSPFLRSQQPFICMERVALVVSSS